MSRGYYYCDLRVDPKDENRVYVLENALMVSKDGGKTFERIGGSVHGDLQALVDRPRGPGANVAGIGWRPRVYPGMPGRPGITSASISLGQFYHVSADDTEAILRSFRRHSGQRHVDRSVAHARAFWNSK